MDTHFDLPQVEADRNRLIETDFAPFRTLRDLPMGMTAHLVFSAIDPDRPATLSPRMMEVIRKDIGFDNLLMTDDIGMQALSGTPADRATAAIAAGCDVVLCCNQPLEQRRAVVEAAGRLSVDGMVRAERAVAQRRIPDDVDILALEREFEALIGEAGHG